MKVRLQVSPVTGSNLGVLFRGDMHHGIREIGEPTCVVGVTMREYHVLDICRLKPHPFDLPNCCIRITELKSRQIDELLSDPLDGIGDISETNS